MVTSSLVRSAWRNLRYPVCCPARSLFKCRHCISIYLRRRTQGLSELNFVIYTSCARVQANLITRSLGNVDLGCRPSFQIYSINLNNPTESLRCFIHKSARLVL